jgi:2-polyprenyl-6-hydroxyphenyl methylase/3-demethylubiquinone-9 3-methyltransferase
MAQRLLGHSARCRLARMNAAELAFPDRRFDMVVCIQNGISAFQVEQRVLVEEAMRVTRPGGTVLFSSYSEAFWERRLEWFRLQAERGLIGAIDEAATGAGVIVCRDGFRATTVGRDEFLSLTAPLGITPAITEVDHSSLFCELIAGPRPPATGGV